jgi:hypothetical protein
MPGWFDFINGQTLPASRVQEYLMDQSVMKFADSGSRAAALPFPTDGMVSYLTDIDRLFVYRSSSSAWVEIVESTNFTALSSGLPTRRNFLLNSAFDIWQRGTSFNNPAGQYTADRYITFYDGSSANRTWSRQTFTPNEIPGNDSQYYMRLNKNGAGSGGTFSLFGNRSEDVRLTANRVLTYSFWAKAAAATSISAYFVQNFGSGGSSEVGTGATAFSLTTSWQRFSVSFTMPSISGKTIGANSYMDVRWNLPLNSTYTIDTFGWQLEAGSVATPFARAATTLQGELAACQRYYYRQTSPSAAYNVFASGSAASTISILYTMKMPTTMRVTPTALDFSTLAATDGPGLIAISSLTIANGTPDTVLLNAGLTGATQFRPYSLNANNSASAFVGLSAEL